MNVNRYDHQYIQRRERWAVAYDAMAEAFTKLISPHSILDVGCAAGHLVEACRKRGIEAHGIDSSLAAESFWPISKRGYYFISDITDPEVTLPATEVVSCMEVAEHISEDKASTLVGNLVKHAPRYVAFTAAPRGASNDPTHVNEQTYAYWIEHFSICNYRLDWELSCAVRVSLRRTGGVPYWYPRNFMMFVPVASPASIPGCQWQSEEERYLNMDFLMLSQLRDLSLTDQIEHLSELLQLPASQLSLADRFDYDVFDGVIRLRAK